MLPMPIPQGRAAPSPQHGQDLELAIGMSPCCVMHSSLLLLLAEENTKHNTVNAFAAYIVFTSLLSSKNPHLM